MFILYIICFITNRCSFNLNYMRLSRVFGVIGVIFGIVFSYTDIKAEDTNTFLLLLTIVLAIVSVILALTER